MIRRNLLRDQACIWSCQQVMKQECQSTGESKSGQKDGRRKFAPKKAIALIEACDEISRESLQQPEIARKGKKNFFSVWLVDWDMTGVWHRISLEKSRDQALKLHSNNLLTVK